jgi:hypothetical protein
MRATHPLVPPEGRQAMSAWTYKQVTRRVLCWTHWVIAAGVRGLADVGRPGAPVAAPSDGFAGC